MISLVSSCLALWIPAYLLFMVAAGETPRRSARLLKTPTRLSNDSAEAESGVKRAKRESAGGKENDVVMLDKNEDRASEEVEAAEKDLATGDSDKPETIVEGVDGAQLNGTAHKEVEEEKKHGDGNPEGAKGEEKEVTGATLANERVELSKDMVIEKEPVGQNTVDESVKMDVNKEADVEMKDLGQEKPNAENGSEINNNGEKVETLANGTGVDEKVTRLREG